MVDAAKNSCAVIHSDSASTIQRLNQEAGKVMYRANENGFNITPEHAITWITSNAAKSLGLADKTGSLENGKNADVVIWSLCRLVYVCLFLCPHVQCARVCGYVRVRVHARVCVRVCAPANENDNLYTCMHACVKTVHYQTGMHLACMRVPDIHNPQLRALLPRLPRVWYQALRASSDTLLHPVLSACRSVSRSEVCTWHAPGCTIAPSLAPPSLGAAHTSLAGDLSSAVLQNARNGHSRLLNDSIRVEQTHLLTCIDP